MTFTCETVADETGEEAAEPSAENKLNQTFDEIVTVIQTALQEYDNANGTNYYPVTPVVECL